MISELKQQWFTVDHDLSDDSRSRTKSRPFTFDATKQLSVKKGRGRKPASGKPRGRKPGVKTVKKVEEKPKVVKKKKVKVVKKAKAVKIPSKDAATKTKKEGKKQPAKEKKQKQKKQKKQVEEEEATDKKE